MAEVLSQSQIDELLRSVAGGSSAEVEQEASLASDAALKARKYDFLTPKRFTKDSLRIIDGIFNNYVRMIQTTLSGVLRLNCEMEILDIEEQKYNEFNNALNDNDVVTVASFRVDEDNYHDQPILVQLSTSIVSVMMDRMLGGVGATSDDSFSGYTDIELMVYENIINHIIPLLNDVWRNSFDVNIAFDRIEGNPRLMQDISIDDTVVIVVLSVNIQEASGQMNVCLPGDSLEVLFKSMEDKRRIAGGRNKQRETRRSSDSADLIMTSISTGTLELSVRLCDAQVSLGDVFHLRVGDVIHLNKPSNSEALLYVENVPWFSGELGIQRYNKALKIKRPVSENL